MRHFAKKLKISEFYQGKLRYMKEIQNRSKPISMMVKILKGEKVDELSVDHERRSSFLFAKLFNNQQSLVVIDGLLFRAIFPTEGQTHQFCLVLENADAERRMVSLHSKEHRGHIYL